MNHLTITITILSLILISTISISVQACSSNSECANQCRPGRVPQCINGECFCTSLKPQSKEAAPATMAVEGCFTSCDCKIECHHGNKICHKNICGCLKHPFYKQPICLGN